MLFAGRETSVDDCNLLQIMLAKGVSRGHSLFI